MDKTIKKHMITYSKIFNRSAFVFAWLLSSSVLLLAQNNNSNYGTISFSFIQIVNGQSALYDTLIYSNNAGNRYEINKVQYFVSEIILHSISGDSVRLSRSAPCHYVDKDYPKTLSWSLPDKILPGKYNYVSFIFGLSKDQNKSYRFRNPPESIMFWPDILGGGYHYMKINIKYLNVNGEISNFNCHLGIGQTKDEHGKIDGFIHNCFSVTLPASSLIIRKGQTSKVEIIMNIEKWFDSPNIIDFNNYHGIMDNQKAMSAICANGKNVFSLIVKE
jgi:hypothetical protein